MTLYATGMRRAEVAALKLSDVDSARMVLHVKEGKAGRDRDIVLTPRLLEELPHHYRRLRSNTRKFGCSIRGTRVPQFVATSAMGRH
jgi:integrase